MHHSHLKALQRVPTVALAFGGGLQGGNAVQVAQAGMCNEVRNCQLEPHVYFKAHEESGKLCAAWQTATDPVGLQRE
jgi:hypothetical protein